MGYYISQLKDPVTIGYAKMIEEKVKNYLADTTTISISFPYKNDILQKVRYAAKAAYRDHPEWFYISRDIEIVNSRLTVTVRLRVIYDVAQLKVLLQRIQAVSNKIAGSFDPKMDLWTRELLIFEHLQKTVTYSTANEECYSVIGALLNHRACCEGVSKAFAFLCHKAGINCITVVNTTHMWNIVQLNGITANVDLTPGLSSADIVYDYFNVTDQDLALDHDRPVGCVPLCTDHSLSYYAVTRTLFKNEAELTGYIVRNHKAGRQKVPIRLMRGNIIKAVRDASIRLRYPTRVSLYCESTNTAEIMLMRLIS